MDLKKNYERFFKQKLEENKTTQPKVKLTEEQKNRFANLSKNLGQRYPNAPLKIFEGNVWMANKKVEPVDKFLNRSALQIQEMVRSFSVSRKNGQQ